MSPVTATVPLVRWVARRRRDPVRRLRARTFSPLALLLCAILTASAFSTGASSAPSGAASGGPAGGAQPPADSQTVKNIKAHGKLIGGAGQGLPGGNPPK